ncbi:MAG: enoyl-CoA hydratase/3-hydroxyacyl-CoA dehydrogenase [Planctomycetota bacterium]|jgi:enoyl-CoA hydratase/3-hydroxyacyl-CoA dehydrogenase
MADLRTLAVVGAGNMGSGIAQKMATEGFRVLLVDLNEAALERGMSNIKSTLEDAVERKIMNAKQAEAVQSRLEGTCDWARISEAEMVVEAVFEDLEVKRTVFKKLSEHAKPDTILGTNTSSFFVRDVASVVENPGRVVGLHYFYHPAKNRLVEVVPTEHTDEACRKKAWAIQEAMGKTPIHCKDAPGFVVNRYFVPWLNEAVRLLEEGVANIATIEAASKKAWRIGMGPFELMNVTGVPIAMHAANTLGEQLGAFYSPAELLKKQVEAKENWSLEGDIDESKFDAVKERMLGVVFMVAGELVDEEVGSIEDTDIGARVGLRWSKGPFELMNVNGIEASVAMAKAICERYDRKMPQVLENQLSAGSPFRFNLVEIDVDGDVCTLSLNRPDAMNAINETMVSQLSERFSEAEANADVKTIVIAGKGKGFIAGADIRFFVKNIEKKDIPAIQTFTEAGQELLNRFAASDKVVVAQLDGLSLGGGSEIAMACDYIVATEKGSMGFPETSIGIYPGLGGTQRLPRRVGIPLARWLILSGAPVTANQALAMGLVDKVAPHEDLGKAIREVAAAGKPDRSAAPQDNKAAGFEAIVNTFGADLDALLALDHEKIEDKGMARAVKSLRFKAPIALKMADELICSTADKTLTAGLQSELDGLDGIFKTHDAYEGLSTLGKSRPQYKGK